MKTIIYVTGTPGTGKTEIASKLTKKLSGNYINLGKICLEKGYVRGLEPAGKSPIVNLKKISQYVKQIISKRNSQPLILDAHFTVKLPAKLKPIIIVLRCEPTELVKRLRRKGFPEKKLYENVWAEILDFCLQEALAAYNAKNVYEIDTTSRKVENVVDEILETVKYRKKPTVGICNWLEMFEKSGKLEEMLFLGEREI